MFYSIMTSHMICPPSYLVMLLNLLLNLWIPVYNMSSSCKEGKTQKMRLMIYNKNYKVSMIHYCQHVKLETFIYGTSNAHYLEVFLL